MLEKLSTKSASILLRRSFVQKFDNSVYVYGFSLLYSTVLITASILLLSSLLNQFTYGFLFLACFIPSRICVGGYHCKTYGCCFIVSNLCFIITYLLGHQILQELNPYFKFLILIFTVIYIYKGVFPPCRSLRFLNKILSIRSLGFHLILLLEIAFIALSYIFPSYVLCADMALSTFIIVALLKYIAKLEGEKP